jgi:ABC-2 type transport system ATP-binding protein
VSAIEVSELVVRYGDVVAVDGVSFTASAGEVVALLGPNGAGKTSTVEALEGYRRFDAGTARVLGMAPGSRDLLPRIGVMLQRGGVYPSMNARDAVRLFASYYPKPLEPEALLERVGLDGSVARTPWRRLSGGEQQRVSLALALVGRPEVVFLDEPTAGIDPHGRAVVRSVVESLREDGACVMLTTHELDEAERLADRVVIVDRGRVVASGTPAELAAGGRAEVRFEAPPGIDVAALGARIGVAVVEDAPGSYRVEAPSSPRLVADLAAWLAEHEVAMTDLRSSERLEDVFLRLTGGES